MSDKESKAGELTSLIFICLFSFICSLSASTVKSEEFLSIASKSCNVNMSDEETKGGGMLFFQFANDPKLVKAAFTSCYWILMINKMIFR